MADIEGTNSGVGDSLGGTRDADQIKGLSGDDYIYAGRGDDTLIGGTGSDILNGGPGADTFQWSAGHLQNGAVDYVKDFSLNAGDTLKFLDSYGQDFEVLAVVRTKLDITEFNGRDLDNNVSHGTDVVFTVRNAADGTTQEIVLLDSWSGSLDSAWDAYLATMGLAFTDAMV